jgi:hypothetical protein
MLSHLSYLIHTWTQDTNTVPATVIEADIIYRVSCKLDACMLIMLARPNPKIRKASLTILADFYKISESIAPHGNDAGLLPLHAILVRTEDMLSRHAMYAFLERDNLGPALTPKVTSKLTLLSINEVASSDYGVLFRFYLGELARRFTLSGRPKALRHCAKFLKQLAIPFMTSVSTVDAEFVATYSSYTILLMSMAGVPVGILVHFLDVILIFTYSSFPRMATL